MFKEFLIVGAGSFMGGGLRFLVSKLAASCISSSIFPYGTFTVNIVGCLLIGILSSMQWTHGIMNDSTKLLAITGFCGGFTTFSTFINESGMLIKNDGLLWAAGYIVFSVTIGFLALVLGQYIGKHLSL